MMDEEKPHPFYFVIDREEIMKIKLSLAIFMLFFIVQNPHTLFGQSNNPDSDNQIYLVTGSSFAGAEVIWSFDPISGEQHSIVDLQVDGYSIPHIEFAQDERHVFLLEVEANSMQFPPLGSSQLIQLNLNTLERDSVYTQDNIVDFVLSPDSGHALIRYYPEGITVIDSSTVASAEWCLVNLRSEAQSCVVQSFGQVTSNIYPAWVDNEVLVYISDTGNSLDLLNVISQTVRSTALLENTLVNSILPIHSSNAILVHLTSTETVGICHLMVIDLDEDTIDNLSELDCPSTVNFMSVSSDGNSLLVNYAGASTFLINLSNGEMIRELDTFYNLEWSSIQWLGGDMSEMAIGILSFRGEPVISATIIPYSNVPINVKAASSDFREFGISPQ